MKTCVKTNMRDASVRMWGEEGKGEEGRGPKTNIREWVPEGVMAEWALNQQWARNARSEINGQGKSQGLRQAGTLFALEPLFWPGSTLEYAEVTSCVRRPMEVRVSAPCSGLLTLIQHPSPKLLHWSLAVPIPDRGT